MYSNNKNNWTTNSASESHNNSLNRSLPSTANAHNHYLRDDQFAPQNFPLHHWRQEDPSRQNLSHPFSHFENPLRPRLSSSMDFSIQKPHDNHSAKGVSPSNQMTKKIPFENYQQVPDSFLNNQNFIRPPPAPFRLNAPPFSSTSQNKFPINFNPQNPPPNLMNNISYSQKELKRKEKILKISDFQNNLLEYAESVQELEDVCAIMQYSPEENWKTSHSRAIELKNTLVHLKNFFNNSDNIDTIKTCINNRRDKRRRKRINEKRQAKKFEETLKERQLKEQVMDRELNRKREIDRKKLMEEKMKKEADIVLSEVRKKQADVEEMKKLISALRTLRNIRVNKGEIHGYIPKPNAQSHFNSIADKLNELIEDPVKEYLLEEKTLRTMMEETPLSSYSHTEKMESRKRTATLDKLKQDLSDIYFGSTEISIENEEAVQQTLFRANNSVDELVKIRCDWDQYIVKDHAVESDFVSSVPLGWILPPMNPNDEWKNYISSE